MIEQRNLNSTNIRTAAYDDDLQTLYIEFNNGRKYKYENIPKTAYENICIAPSAGKYLKQISNIYRAVEYY